MTTPPPGFLRIPRALRIEILSYVLPHGAKIKVKPLQSLLRPYVPPVGSAERVGTMPQIVSSREWRKELAGLMGEQPDPVRYDEQVLQTCRELRDSAAGLFWSRNTFDFESVQAFKLFMKQSSNDVKRALPSIILGEDTMFSDNAVRQPGQSLPPLSILAPLQSLTTLELKVGLHFWSSKVQPKDYEALYRPKDIDLPHCLASVPEPDRPAGHYAHDTMLLSIPYAVMVKLRSVKIQRTTVGDFHKSCEALQYTVELRRGRWKKCPFERRNAVTGRFEPVDEWKALCWLEARAAVHWDHDLPTSWGVWKKREEQWCTWSREWWQWKEDGEDGRPMVARSTPRKWEEMFDEQSELREGCKRSDWVGAVVWQRP